jgi:hypothetical protein
MPPVKLHEAEFLTVVWDESTRIIGIEWKDSTAAMIDDDFKAALAMFAGHVEAKQAIGILVDVKQFRYKMGPEVQQWRVKNISTRYNRAGVKRFAFLMGEGATVPPAMNRSAEGESFVTRGFNDREEAIGWLTQPG